MKRMFLLITCITLGSMITCSDSKRRRVIIVENPANPITGFCEFDRISDEINLNIPQLLIDNNNPVTSARDLINLSRTSKHLYDLSHDKEVVKLIQNPILIALNNPRFLYAKTRSLTDDQKSGFLTEVYNIQSNAIQNTICRRLEQLAMPFFSKFRIHPIILSAIEESNLSRFELCQKLLNIYPAPFNNQFNFDLGKDAYLHHLRRCAQRTLTALIAEQRKIYKRPNNSQELTAMRLLIQDAKVIQEKLK